MFDTILIANRGEIACRVIRTAHRIGVRCVAIFSDADADALHVEMADEAVHIGPAPARDSYLKADAIIEAAKRTGAEAIHPGYGFLSENPDFVEAVTAAGLTFIGPPATAIRAMGLKDAAKARMEAAGVAVVPGYHGSETDADVLAARADEIGYPVLLKARAGGGGKGMRLVERAADFHEAYDSARSEAVSSFGDGACLVEKFITRPRHIEIQVFGDHHGNAVHLFERDCSLQRRHQKVIEEAPAPGMTREMREAMGEAAVRAARAIGYAGAGTVEFIVDASDGLRPDRFYFMEMNTRLQVEHPVTEMITGHDLVEWQLRIAAGERLPVRQEDLAIDGWAMEARLYAEDPSQNFLPATGLLDHFEISTSEIRVDSGVRSGDAITPFYDPMIAKLVAHGPDRDAARRQLIAALQATAATGVTTNAGFLVRLLKTPAFAVGDVHTGLIADVMDAVAPPQTQAPDLAWVAAALLEIGNAGSGHNQYMGQDTREDTGGGTGEVSGERKDKGENKGPGRTQGRSPFRLWSPARSFADLATSTKAASVVVTHLPEHRIAVERRPLEQLHDPAASVPLGQFQCVQITSDGAARKLTLEHEGQRFSIRAIIGSDGAIHVLLDGDTHTFHRHDHTLRTVDGGAQGDEVTAPTPGIVKRVLVEPGRELTAGSGVIVLESMKMEQTLAAPRDAVVAEVLAEAGQQVSAGETLVRFHSSDGA